MDNYIIQPNKPNVVSEQFEGEIILVNLINGNYYSLRDAGARIWKLIEMKRSKADILEGVRCMYSLHEESMPSISQFLEQLAGEQLVKILPADDAQSEPLDQEPVDPATFEPPILETYSDMQDLLLLDPIHDVDEESGWPEKPADAS